MNVQRGVGGMQWLTRLKTFLNEVVVETRKVTWPTTQEVTSTTTVVVVASFIFGIYLYFCDFVFLTVTRKLFGVFGVFSG
jgi:preprotein translocase subunit SecE